MENLLQMRDKQTKIKQKCYFLSLIITKTF